MGSYEWCPMCARSECICAESNSRVICEQCNSGIEYCECEGAMRVEKVTKLKDLIELYDNHGLSCIGEARLIRKLRKENKRLREAKRVRK